MRRCTRMSTRLAGQDLSPHANAHQTEKTNQAEDASIHAFAQHEVWEHDLPKCESTAAAGYVWIYI